MSIAGGHAPCTPTTYLHKLIKYFISFLHIYLLEKCGYIREKGKETKTRDERDERDERRQAIVE